MIPKNGPKKRVLLKTWLVFGFAKPSFITPQVEEGRKKVDKGKKEESW
jgi:hypothetical protein